MISILNFIKKFDQKLFCAGALAILIAIFGIYTLTYRLATQLRAAYTSVESPIIRDRNGRIVKIQRNGRGYYARKSESVPQEFKNPLIKKEDRFFYFHFGINPFSILRDATSYITTGKLEGSSTLTQQLVKILLGNEGRRTLWNKLVEAIYAVSIEMHASKNEILRMYADAAYFGNQAQGIEEASLFYFNSQPEALTDNEIISLLVALNNPSGRYPGSFENRKILPYFGDILGVNTDNIPFKIGKNEEGASARKNKAAFEVDSLGTRCSEHCELTIDIVLTETIRDILERNLNLPSFANVDNGAVVVIKLPENELLSVIGSPDPESLAEGFQINMAVRARPIGSTAKPFIYLNAFEKGARPYSLVEDQEYAYQIGTGFAFYPKNYDGKYRGAVTLHQALSNSLNVPSVKVLEFAGLEKIYDFLKNSLGFKPFQPLENYELGIALGALEMDLLTLSHYFTIFPNEGALKPLKIKMNGSKFLTTPMGSEIQEEKRVTQKKFTELINKILSDREAAAEQFGMKSNLTLNHNNYALKTGTSRDFHDSWTVGYTPDFLVGVWLGNSDNTPMRQISGQLGAGKIWHEVMEILLNSSYNQNTPFRFDSLKEFTDTGNIEYGLQGDDYNIAKLFLKEYPLIIHPHNKDVFLYKKKTIIPLRAEKSVEWFVSQVKDLVRSETLGDNYPASENNYSETILSRISGGVNNSFIGKGVEISWGPTRAGLYVVTARSEDGKEKNITIRITDEE